MLELLLLIACHMQSKRARPTSEGSCGSTRLSAAPPQGEGRRVGYQRISVSAEEMSLSLSHEESGCQKYRQEPIICLAISIHHVRVSQGVEAVKTMELGTKIGTDAELVLHTRGCSPSVSMMPIADNMQEPYFVG